MRKLLQRYNRARDNWIQAGKPKRSKAEITEIFETKCKPCPEFQKVTETIGRCKMCGCALNLGTNLNKIMFATESCPKKEPEWVAHIIFDDEGNPIPNPDYKGGHRLAETRRQRRIRERNERKERKNQEAEKRSSDRRKRADERAREIAALGRHADPIELPANEDPLQTFSRVGTKHAGHPYRDLWKLSPAFLVCGGPSVNKLDLSPLKDPRVCSMGVNNVVGWIQGLKAWVFGDPSYKFNGSIFMQPNILKFVPVRRLSRKKENQIRFKNEDGEFHFSPIHVRDAPNVIGFNRHGHAPPKRLGMDPPNFFKTEHAMWGGPWPNLNEDRKILYSPYLGLRLLHYLGVRTVYLLGVDHTMSSDAGYSFPQGRTSGAVKTNNEHYKIVNPILRELRKVFDDHGFTVTNCNPESHCDAFDYVPYEKAVESCLELQGEWPLDLKGWYEPSKQLKDFRLKDSE